MLECFGVFSKVIALICMGSQCAAPPTALPSRRRTGTGPALTKAREVGEGSTARFVPAARRGIAERWELPLPPLRLECFGDRHPNNPAEVQADPTTRPPYAEFIGANRFFASLVFHQACRRTSVTSAEPGSGSTPKRNLRSTLVAAPDTGSPREFAQPTTREQNACPPVEDSIETRFSELARTRLRSLAAPKKSSL
jgi:hypothetical protein